MSNWGTVTGPDVSFYQDSSLTLQQIDFMQMKRAGADFVIIRAGQGSYADPDFAYNWTNAKAAGLPRGAYWFYDSRTDPIVQAQKFINLLADLPEIGAWLDLEEAYGGTYKGWQNWVRCLTELNKFLPRVGIYTAPSYWMTNRPTGSEALSFFKSFDLWIANYNVISPLIPSPWTSAVFWQYGTPALGLQFGCESKEIDMNYFNGDAQYFRNYFDLDVQPTEGETMYQGKTTADAKIWKTIGGTQITTLKTGTAVTGAAPMASGYTYINTPTAGYTKTEWLQPGYKEVVVTPPPPPAPTTTKTPFTLTVDGFKPYQGELEKA